jgi:hypothetical protein
MYATGFVGPSDDKEPARFLRSTNGGVDWTLDVIPNTDSWNMAYVAAIHPADSNKVFLRIDSWTHSDSPELGKDALVYSHDGGKTWVELLRPGGSDPLVAGGKLLGFALSPDGTTALAAFGDLVEADRKVDPGALGLYASARDGTFSFEASRPIWNESVTCLTWTQRGVYACTSTLAERIGLVFSSDPALASSSFVSLFRRDTVGPPAACTGRASTQCDWTYDCNVVGVCPSGDAGPPPSADASDDAPVTAGDAPVAAGSQCDCTLSRRAGRADAGAVMALLLAMGLRARSRRSVEPRR